VRNQDGRDVVYIIQNGRAERRAVTITRAQDGEVSVTAGVSAGERVAIEAPAGLADGVAVAETKP
jgi:multidrug efflux pump subunit AcrA (membrane-fusion protein)